GLAAAAIFLFIPAEMIISGYHCNAEPAVIACVMGAMYLAIPENAGKRTGWFYVVIGLSLGVKHAFAFFPIWLAMQPGSRSERLRALLIPYAVYLLILLPFLIPSPRFWFNNVVMYSAWSGNGLIPRALGRIFEALGLELGMGSRVWV